MIYTRMRHIRTVGDLLDHEGNWCSILNLRGQLHNYHRVGEDILVDLMDHFSAFGGALIANIGSCDGWS